jgi:hypothetical protein
LLSTTEIFGVSKNIRRDDSIDRELTVMAVRAVSNMKPIATLVNFACHPETLWSDNRLITADFPGYLCQRVEKEWGGVSLYLNGALGGMVTVDVGVDKKWRELHTFQEARRVGEALAVRVLEGLSKANHSPVSRMHVQKRELAVPLENWRFRAARWLGIMHRSLKGNQVLTEVWSMDLGEAKLITVPGELLPNLGLKLKERMGGKYRFLLGLANDELGYILSREDYHDDLYAYERSMSIGPEIGPRVYGALTDLLSQ